jgi:hypothetical protein
MVLNMLRLAIPILAVSVFTSGAAEQAPRVFVSGADAVVVQGIKAFQKTCPSVTITARQDNADYTVLVADDGSGAARKGRSAVVSTAAGDVVLASSARGLGSAVKNACGAIERNWAAKKK